MKLEDWIQEEYKITWRERLKLWLFVTRVNIRSPIYAWIDKVAIKWLEGRQYHVEDYESVPPPVVLSSGIDYCSRCGTGLGFEDDCFERIDI